MGTSDMPAAEIDVDESLVRALLTDQHPDLAHLALTPLAYGWDNAIFRLGTDLTVRLPRRAAAAGLIDHEHRWLPKLAVVLPLPVPVPVRVGYAASSYPWSWTIGPWLPGTMAAESPSDDMTTTAQTLGEFVAALHKPAPPDAPPNPYRGGPLADRDAKVRERIEQLGTDIDGPATLTRWSELVMTLRWTKPPLWLHGDLHPANLLVHEGRLSAVIDFGDITSGDPAVDLAVAWMMFPPDARAVFRAAAGEVDDDTWSRAQGWALALALAYLASSADNPLMARIGHQTLAAVLAHDGENAGGGGGR